MFILYQKCKYTNEDSSTKCYATYWATQNNFDQGKIVICYWTGSPDLAHERVISNDCFAVKARGS